MPKHLFKVSDQNKDFYERLLIRASQIDSGKYKPSKDFHGKSMGMIFFEPSSRTNWSFHKAAQDMGLKVMSTYVDSSTSLSKGESLEDALKLFFNLNFDLVVMRSKADMALAKVVESQKEKVHFINAGFGTLAHPTQALLDAYTWCSHCNFTKPPKVLIMGDLKHSRVVRSHLRLAQILSYEVGLCPLKFLGLSLEEEEEEEELLGLSLEKEERGEERGEEKEKENKNKELKPTHVFDSRQEAIDWADIVMPLRIQKERFTSVMDESCVAEPLNLEDLSERHWLMHPGPIIWGEDLTPEFMQYPKSLISLQQRSGVTCRAALISLMMEEA